MGKIFLQIHNRLILSLHLFLILSLFFFLLGASKLPHHMSARWYYTILFCW